MAILGFLAHALPEDAPGLEKKIKKLPGMTTYGIHQNSYIVVVAEAPVEQMEAHLESVRGLGA